ncbi:MAG: MarR family transcriptional regulator [Streptomycetaceae bacterium]|nr:MarR family transcriptional regulator [Streptomycetaceae bacterium]
MAQAQARRDTWTFLTNHARVLAAVADEPDSRLRDIAARCDLTERAVQAIIADLEHAGYLTHARVGRRNMYNVVPGTHLRHRADSGKTVADLLALDIERRDRGAAPAEDSPP